MLTWMHRKLSKRLPQYLKRKGACIAHFPDPDFFTENTMTKLVCLYIWTGLSVHSLGNVRSNNSDCLGVKASIICVSVFCKTERIYGQDSELLAAITVVCELDPWSPLRILQFQLSTCTYFLLSSFSYFLSSDMRHLSKTENWCNANQQSGKLTQSRVWV